MAMTSDRFAAPEGTLGHRGDSRNFLAAVLEHSRDVTVLLDGGGRIQRASGGTKVLLGYTPHELIGVDCLDL